MTNGKIILISDTNVITDLYIAGESILEKFLSLENVYMCSLVKNYEINSNTCPSYFHEEIKMINEDSLETNEASKLSSKLNGLSIYDLLNFSVCKKRGFELATGDQKLRKYSEEFGVSVKGVLKIMDEMLDENLINYSEYKEGLTNLLNDENVRLPETEINKRINETISC